MECIAPAACEHDYMVRILDACDSYTNRISKNDLFAFKRFMRIRSSLMILQSIEDDLQYNENKDEL